MAGLENSIAASESSPVSLAALSEKERHAAMERFRLLRPHLEDGASLPLVASESGITYRTAARWASLYRRFGLVALARKGRADKGLRRGLSRRMRQVIEGLALQRPPIPIATICRKTRLLAQEHGEPLPEYSTVYSVIRKLPADLMTLAQEGTKAYSNAFDLVHRQEAAHPNAVWQADHTLLDILVLREGTDAARPWLTIIEDDYSRAIAGYFLSFDAPSAIRTSLALRMAIWRKEDPRWPVFGIPEVLYTDNGRDFTSQHLEQVAADLKIRLVFSMPGQPRGRGRIERFFSSLNQMCLSGLPGYAPPGKSGSRSHCGLNLSEFDAHIREFLLSEYHERPHGGTGIAPRERWESGGFLPHIPDSLEQLDLLLLTVAKNRRIHRDGIRFQGQRYVDPALAAYIGEFVTLRYDPRDIAEIRIFHEGKFLCRAVCPELAGETVPLREILRARARRHRELRATLQDRKNTVKELLDLKRGRTEPAEDTLEKTEVPSTDAPVRLKRYLNE